MFFKISLFKRGLLLKIAVGGVVVILIVIGILLIIQIWNSLSPKKILGEAALRFEELKTFHFDVFFEKEVSQPQQKTIKHSMVVSGDLDNTSKEEPKWQGET